MKNSWLLHIHLLGYYCDHPLQHSICPQDESFVLAVAAASVGWLGWLGLFPFPY
jgi:hypothetical protein